MTTCRYGLSLAFAERSHADARLRGKTPRARGFTVIELMVTVTVLAILLVVAVPSFRSFILSSRLTTTANDIVGAISLARMQSIMRNSNAQLCSSSGNGNDTLGTACGSKTGAVYLLTGTTATQVRAGTAGIGTSVQLTGSMKAVRFNGTGLGSAVGSTTPYTGLVADICTSEFSGDNHRKINMTAGSIVTVTSSKGACP